MNFLETGTMEDRLELMMSLSKKFLTRAHQVDIEGSFPYQNIDDLKETGYTTLTVPAIYGGKEISLFELVRLQETIAEGDGATALSIGWHMGIIMNLHEKKVWDESTFKFLCEKVNEGALINSAQTEAKTGSPTRGGRPETNAVKIGKEWMIT